ncbi:MAG: hypothetical protein CL874_04685 [Dehalococcoidales bacterium]|jgi:hypothetical protein|nr:hypothetical protein [Dehalococcoidales bacterium]MDP6577226.1 hypothetical protein [Dehalococcoidales bacterium]MDP6825313.1 hypothetical protein [Dehalococcoidales bacterium]
MNTGKLYRHRDNEFVAEIDYQLHEETSNSWWGELLLTDPKRISESDGYIIELENNHRGNCRLRKRVNRAVTGIPPRYVYQFTGTGSFQDPPTNNPPEENK